MKTMRNRVPICRGATIVEIAVALVVAVMVVGVVWGLFLGDQRRFHLDQDRLTGLTGALLMDEALSTDLQRVAVFLSERESDRFHLERPVEIEAAGRQLRFRMFGEVAPEEPRVPTVMVTYRVDEATSRVVRTEGDHARTFPDLVAMDLAFNLVHAPAPRATGFHGSSGGPPPLVMVKYRLRCRVQRENGRLPGPGPAAPVTLVGAVPLPYVADRLHMDFHMVGPGELLAPP